MHCKAWELGIEQKSKLCKMAEPIEMLVGLWTRGVQGTVC